MLLMTPLSSPHLGLAYLIWPFQVWTLLDTRCYCKEHLGLISRPSPWQHACHEITYLPNKSTNGELTKVHCCCCCCCQEWINRKTALLPNSSYAWTDSSSAYLILPSRGRCTTKRSKHLVPTYIVYHEVGTEAPSAVLLLLLPPFWFFFDH